MDYLLMVPLLQISATDVRSHYRLQWESYSYKDVGNKTSDVCSHGDCCPHDYHKLNHQKSVHKFVNMKYYHYLCTQNKIWYTLREKTTEWLLIIWNRTIWHILERWLRMSWSFVASASDAWLSWLACLQVSWTRLVMGSGTWGWDQEVFDLLPKDKNRKRKSAASVSSCLDGGGNEKNHIKFGFLLT